VIDLSGKRAPVVGVANEHSIAWGVAKAFRDAGAELAITYLNVKAEPHVRPLAESVGAPIIMPLDVTVEEQEKPLFEKIQGLWGRLDIFVHSIAYAPGEDLSRARHRLEPGGFRNRDGHFRSFLPETCPARRAPSNDSWGSLSFHELLRRRKGR
jgi:enoyl-[acyl-carrier protein] reductase I